MSWQTVVPLASVTACGLNAVAVSDRVCWGNNKFGKRTPSAADGWEDTCRVDATHGVRAAVARGGHEEEDAVHGGGELEHREGAVDCRGGVRALAVGSDLHLQAGGRQTGLQAAPWLGRQSCFLALSAPTTLPSTHCQR